MLRIDKIYVQIPKPERNTTSKIIYTLEGKLKEVASATPYRIEKHDKFKKPDEPPIEVILKKPISLQTANQIIKALCEERLIIYGLKWERKDYNGLILGYLEISVS